VNFLQHSKINLALASILTLIFYFQHSHLFSYVEFVLGPFPIKDFLLDLDSESSIPCKLWGPFKFIWSPFDHRELLHNVFWGPFILVSFVKMPLYYGGFELPGWTIVGMVCMIWSHIIVDKIDSKVKKVF
jgi:uncharacterized metal-binding protein